MELFELSAAQAAERIRLRELSPVELVEALLRRIDALEPKLQAWETVDRSGALAAAHLCEQLAGRNEPTPLLGIPLGVKDIFFTEGLRTTGGSPIFQDFVPKYDATSVSKLRKLGAIVLGKTVTVQFAYTDPPRTRNPWNLDRTPGGSSSGSAAAVAARMVPVALGSQTGGSTLRPAAYCGLVGLKPTYGRVSRFGVMVASWSLDHVGVLARNVVDAALVLQAMAGPDPRDRASSGVAVNDYTGAAMESYRAPRLGLVTGCLPYAQPEAVSHFQEIAALFERSGAEVREVSFPIPLPDLLAIRNIIGQVEAADLHAATLREHPQHYAPRIRSLVEVGQLVPGAAYIHAQRLRGWLRPQVESMLAGVDCLLMPTVTGVAPDPSTTGDSSFQAVWSLFGFPAITVPSGLSAGQLPLGAQLIAAPFREEFVAERRGLVRGDMGADAGAGAVTFSVLSSER